MITAEFDAFCFCGAMFGNVAFECDGVPTVHVCPRCGEVMMATVIARFEMPFGVSAEGASWAMEAQS